MAKTNSILGQLLREMDTLSPQKDDTSFLEERAKRAFDTAVKLMEIIESKYDADTAEELKKRFLSSVKRKSLRKFEIGVKSLKENKK